MKLSDFLDLSPDRLKELTADEIKDAARNAVATAKKRIHALEQAELLDASPIAQALLSNEKKFLEIAGSKRMMIAKVQRLQSFLRAESSTVKGVKAQQQRVNQRLGTNLTPQQQRKLWHAYEKFKTSKKAGILNALGSERVQRYIAEKIQNDNDFDSDYEIGMRELERMEEEEKRDEYQDLFEQLGLF